MSNKRVDMKINFTAVDPTTEMSQALWHEVPEGQLTIDVYQNELEVIIIAPMAGARMASVDVSIHHDLLTIRGERRVPISIAGYSPLYLECFWGPFSRTVVLPSAVNVDRARASCDGSVLCIRIPKHGEHAQIPITIVED
jgi:HSP20 family protein